MPIPVEELQKLSPSALVTLFVFDTTIIGGTDVLYFHSGTNEINSSVVWQGITYTRFPILATGFDRSGKGQSPRPRMKVSNVQGFIGALCKEYDDFRGAKIIRKRTFLKYLDAINFTDGLNPTADPSIEFINEIWFVNRKVAETSTYVDFELSAAFDVVGQQLPARQVMPRCTIGYRSAECGYAGAAVADKFDQPTTTLSLDQCSKSVKGCEFRFGANKRLPHGGFPAVGLVK